MKKQKKNVAIIVAHPDDEILWAGGIIMNNPSWNCFVISLCRKNDPDRAPKFARVLNILGAQGAMGDLDDSPEQAPLQENQIENMIMALLPQTRFDLLITHSIYGEYTRHLRHEEIGKAVIRLWNAAKIATRELWAFAYEDHQRKYFPVAIEDAPLFYPLPHKVWARKYDVVTNTYGFNPNSWEAKTTPKEEAFWQFFSVGHARRWLVGGEA